MIGVILLIAMNDVKIVPRENGPLAKTRARQRCIGCGARYPTNNVMASTIGLCRECNQRLPFGWRTVYDRERRMGRIPSNLASVR